MDRPVARINVGSSLLALRRTTPTLLFATRLNYRDHDSDDVTLPSFDHELDNEQHQNGLFDEEIVMDMNVPLPWLSRRSHSSMEHSETTTIKETATDLSDDEKHSFLDSTGGTAVAVSSSATESELSTTITTTTAATGLTRWLPMWSRIWSIKVLLQHSTFLVGSLFGTVAAVVDASSENVINNNVNENMDPLASLIYPILVSDGLVDTTNTDLATFAIVCSSVAALFYLLNALVSYNDADTDHASRPTTTTTTSAQEQEPHPSSLSSPIVTNDHHDENNNCHPSSAVPRNNGNAVLDFIHTILVNRKKNAMAWSFGTAALLDFASCLLLLFSTTNEAAEAMTLSQPSLNYLTTDASSLDATNGFSLIQSNLLLLPPLSLSPLKQLPLEDISTVVSVVAMQLYLMTAIWTVQNHWPFYQQHGFINSDLFVWRKKNKQQEQQQQQQQQVMSQPTTSLSHCYGFYGDGLFLVGSMLDACVSDLDAVTELWAKLSPTALMVSSTTSSAATKTLFMSFTTSHLEVVAALCWFVDSLLYLAADLYTVRHPEEHDNYERQHQQQQALYRAQLSSIEDASVGGGIHESNTSAYALVTEG